MSQQLWNNWFTIFSWDSFGNIPESPPSNVFSRSEQCLYIQLAPVWFILSVVPNSMWPPGLQHDSHPCPSLSTGVDSNSCPLSQSCHPATSSSVAPFSSCFQSFPALGSFPMSWLFASDDQSIGASVSASVLPMNIQDWFPLELTGLISLLSKGLSRVFSNTTVQKHQFIGTRPSLWANSHICTWLLEKPDLWLYGL